MKTVPILDVAENITSGPSKFDGSCTYYATADVDGATLLDGTPVFYSERPSRANLAAKNDDVLFAKMQATDKVVHVNGEAKYAIFSTGFFNLRAHHKKIDPRYLFWFVRSPRFQVEKDRRCTGATQKALTLAGLREIEIPCPETIAEQRRISAILDKADGVRCKCEQTLAMTDALLRSEFLDRFGSPLTNRKGIEKAPIRTLGNVVTGNTPPRKEPENYGTEIEWIKSDNINTPSYFLTMAVEYLSPRGKAIGRLAPAGATLVTCIAGSPSVIGNAALADREVAFNQQINAVIPKDGVDPYFLYCQFLIGKELIQASSTNSMKGMVSKGKFQEIEFLNPSPGEQAKFGRFFERTNGLIQNLQSRYAESEAAFAALCQRAFRGEL